MPGALGAATNTRRQALMPYPYYGAVTVINTHLGNYVSHLYLLSVEKKSARCLTLMFSYT